MTVQNLVIAICFPLAFFLVGALYLMQPKADEPPAYDTLREPPAPAPPTLQ